MAIPAILLALLAGGYVVFLGPRSYDASAVYVVVNPDTPSASELERDSRLARLNNDNPYLRAADQSLIVKVLLAKMASQEVQEALKNAGLSTDYSVAQSPLSTMTVVVTATASSPRVAVATRQWLLDDLVNELGRLQTVAGADRRYLFSALPIDVAPQPVERVSSRLRALILVLVAGAILAAAAVSIAASYDRMRRGSGRSRNLTAPQVEPPLDQVSVEVVPADPFVAPQVRAPSRPASGSVPDASRDDDTSGRRTRGGSSSTATVESSTPSWDW